MKLDTTLQVEVIADTNDGDYVTKVSQISENWLTSIENVAKAIKDFKSYEHNDRTYNHNWPDYDISIEKCPHAIYVESGKITEEEIAIFDELVPYNEDGVHTIVTIKITEVLSTIILL